MNQCIPRLFGFALGIIALLGAAAGARGAEAPRWKFEPGATNRYRMTQVMKIGMNVGVGGQAAPTVTNVIDMSWTVDEVKPDGSAVLRQKMDRMRLTVETAGEAEAAGAPPMEFDSQSNDEPRGFAAMIAPLARALTTTEFTVTQTPLGKITDVQIPEEAVKAIAAAPGAELLGDMATADGLKNMIERSSFAMPETLETGTEWSSTAEMNNPMLGKQTITTTYRYVGPKEIEGVQYEVFEPTLTIEYAGGLATANITKQESSGEILFSRSAGRLESTKLDHSMAMTIAAAGNTMNQTLDQNVELKWLPENAE